MFTNHLGSSYKSATVAKCLQWELFSSANIWMQFSWSVLFLSVQFAVTSWKKKHANESQMWHGLLICTFVQNHNTFGTNFVYSLVSKNRIVPIIQQVQRQSLPMGQFVDFRDSSLKFSSGERYNEYPVHISEVTQACNSTLICFFLLLWGKENSFCRLC